MPYDRKTPISSESSLRSCATCWCWRLRRRRKRRKSTGTRFFKLAVLLVRDTQLARGFFLVPCLLPLSSPEAEAASGPAGKFSMNLGVLVVFSAIQTIDDSEYERMIWKMFNPLFYCQFYCSRNCLCKFCPTCIKVLLLQHFHSSDWLWMSSTNSSDWVLLVADQDKLMSQLCQHLKDAAAMQVWISQHSWLLTVAGVYDQFNFNLVVCWQYNLFCSVNITFLTVELCPCVCSHAVNLLNNLPVSCLDVLIDVPVLGGDENYSGKNMDAVQKLLDFMEKRVDKVKFFPSATPARTPDRNQ